GTLLLDEIGEMPLATQAKLLRVIEDGKVRRLGGASDIPVSVRVLAATNRSPEAAVKNRLLREDLYYRLNVFHIALPPLRERKQDIPLIAETLIRDLNSKHGCRVTNLSAEVLSAFQARSWPGNVRELRNLIERAVIMASEGEIQPRHLPGAVSPPPVPAADSAEVLHIPVGARISDVEKAYVQLTLKHTRNNKTRAAELLGLCLRTLHYKLRAYSSEGDREAPSWRAGKSA
ncbi:MAG TPA: sigma 54-interacting transcriptional regulator, partial [Bryobacteraceae bacterium]|nr:sigma 54-interacting transcriptional regulator [Bryobacteraceae bacterium]